MKKCSFCDREPVTEFGKAKAFYDEYPVRKGHMLIVPKRHIGNFWVLTREEYADMLELARRCELRIDRRYAPDGYNLGVNIGSWAGQTVDHVHLHMIPRYARDVDDPRGGVRNLVPNPEVKYP